MKQCLQDQGAGNRPLSVIRVEQEVGAEVLELAALWHQAQAGKVRPIGTVS